MIFTTHALPPLQECHPEWLFRSSLYFPEADKQPSSTGQLWYTAWCPLLQVRGEGRGEERGMSLCLRTCMPVFMRVCVCVSTDLRDRCWFVVCTSVFVLVVAISLLPLL